MTIFSFSPFQTFVPTFLCIVCRFCHYIHALQISILQLKAMMNGQRVNYARNMISQQEREQPELVQGTNSHFQHCFALFLDSFTRENIRVYHRQLETQLARRRPVLTIQLADLRAFEELLYERIIASPLETTKIMEDSVRLYLKHHNGEFADPEDDCWWQIALRSDELPRRLREVDSSLVSKLFSVSGIVITATKPYIKASKLRLQCKSCQSIKIIELAPGQNPYVPIFCSGQEGARQKCPSDPYVALPDSEVIDAQTIKIQENPQDVPPGEIARTYTVVVDRFNVSRCVPGDRVQVTGVMLMQEVKTESLSKGYIYALDVFKLRERASFNYSEHEEELFKSMAKDPNIRQKIYESIAPGIFGNEDIKKAIACMLFGGSRKHLPDKTMLRGDINVLLIGDPSTAKSQFLKFVQQTASIAVYTSGKGSSAAGLTASITKDGMTGEFQIQGGALVLADGGIVCIDEFDKMKPQDRVAIHQAMEQQTISVAKAGITTRLNSRTSVLAAANPIFGRYDELKQISEQIQLQTTILSRFDCIFVVRDLNTRENNERIANHILGLHQGRINRDSAPEITFQLLKKYIKYSKSKVHPRLSPLAAEKLQEIYVADRQKAYQYKKLTQSKNTIPITVRQLEAVIRLGQALARMKLRTCVGVDEINEAHHLFELSTLKTVEGKEFGYEISEETTTEVKKIEDAIKKRVCVGTQVSIAKLMDDMSERYGNSSVGMAIRNMVMNQEFREIKGKKLLIRER